MGLIHPTVAERVCGFERTMIGSIVRRRRLVGRRAERGGEDLDQPHPFARLALLHQLLDQVWVWGIVAIHERQLEQRRQVVSAWAYGSNRIGRQMFRVLRSTALLSFYEEAQKEETDSSVAAVEVVG